MTPTTVLTPDELDRIRASYDAVRLEMEPASTAFYDFLFARDPALKDLFRDDLAGQGMRFMTTLGVIVAALDDPGKLSQTLGRLGQGHSAMGIRAVDFDPMEQALMDTFDLILGKGFTTQDQAAWRKAYRFIANAMIAEATGEVRQTT